MIITIHDLAFFEVPTMYNTMRRFYKQSIAEYSIRRAAHVIAISEKTRADILARFKISDNKITTIAYGKSPSFKRLSAEKHVSLSKKYDLFRPFFLFVGTLQPRKNLHNLVAAFGRVRRETDLPHELVVAGEKGWLTRDVVELAGEHGVADRVRQLGAVPHADMAALYNCAEALVYPSWYEGFGLPPLEAMACGTPVIASRAASLPEVVGDAGILVDPSDVPGLADAMCRIVRDKALREDLIRRGLARAEMYSWEKCARETFTVYRRVYEQTKRHAPV
jgi:glycosyltransferase involved in cell wall biosynthesis